MKENIMRVLLNRHCGRFRGWAERRPVSFRLVVGVETYSRGTVAPDSLRLLGRREKWDMLSHLSRTCPTSPAFLVLSSLSAVLSGRV